MFLAECTDTGEAGDNQLQAGTSKPRQQATHDPADVSALGGQKKFYRVFPPFWGKIARTVKKWEIYRPACISKLGGILCPIKGILKRSKFLKTPSHNSHVKSTRKREP